MTLLTAKAYLDQLARGSSLPGDQIAAIKAHIDAKNTKKLHADAKTAEKAAAAAKTPMDADRLSSLSIILKSDGIAGARAGE